jgi:hypothetical protein
MKRTPKFLIGYHPECGCATAAMSLRCSTIENIREFRSEMRRTGRKVKSSETIDDLNNNHPNCQTIKRTCQHPRLHFGSGDYYLFCYDCDARWIIHNGKSPEYGINSDGVKIGADSSMCTGHIENQDRIDMQAELANLRREI